MREFWIEVNKYNEVVGDMLGDGPNSTHVIEYSAYEQSQSRIAELEADNEKLKSANRILREGLNDYINKHSARPDTAIKALAEAAEVMGGEDG